MQRIYECALLLLRAQSVYKTSLKSPFAEWAALTGVYRRGFFNEFRAIPYTPTALNFGAVASASADAGPEAGPSTPTGATVKTDMPSAGTNARWTRSTATTCAATALASLTSSTSTRFETR